MLAVNAPNILSCIHRFRLPVKDLLAGQKQNPERSTTVRVRRTIASCGRAFNSVANVNIAGIPYRGVGPALGLLGPRSGYVPISEPALPA
jgi:hypothetical protein